MKIITENGKLVTTFAKDKLEEIYNNLPLVSSLSFCRRLEKQLKIFEYSVVSIKCRDLKNLGILQKY